MKHYQLVESGFKWLTKFGCAFVFKELVTSAKETPDVIGFKGSATILIECKTSRSDFKSDAKKVFRQLPAEGMGRFRFYLCPEGLIKVEELPKNWGLLYVKKEKAYMVHNPYCASIKGNIWKGGFYKRNKDGEYSMMYSALRRLQILNLVGGIYKIKGYK